MAATGGGRSGLHNLLQGAVNDGVATSAGVNPAVSEVEEEKEETVLSELSTINGGRIQLPAVFVGGKLFGGLDRVMSTHITGELVPI
ncbi:Glutaredoxin-C9 [Hibiscus syriacus]|uniref:Glutaredoxin-C9 n=1 Tax=Hibiscus syriacus TaxID=106335 RepID=A0A6A2XMT7_HIBSY|nr:Glutaredoxin-C9 [Hibiscus syriacus]